MPAKQYHKAATILCYYDLPSTRITAHFLTFDVLNFFLRKYRNLFNFFIIHQYRAGEGGWNSFWWISRMCLRYIAAENLAMQGARASAAEVSTGIFFLDSVPEKCTITWTYIWYDSEAMTSYLLMISKNHEDTAALHYHVVISGQFNPLVPGRPGYDLQYSSLFY